MKRVLLLMVWLAFLSIASAEEKPAAFSKSLERHSWELGPEIYYFKYEEPGYMKDTGIFYGVSGAYTYRPWVPAFPEDKPAIKWIFRAEAGLSMGNVDYDGAIQNFETSETTPYNCDNIRDYLTELRLLLGVDFPKETFVDTIYAGIGQRYLEDNGSSDPYGYDRASRYRYVPVGVKTVRRITGNWLLAATAEYDLLLDGRQTTDLREFGLWTFKNRQNGGYGMRGSVRLEKKGKAADFIIEPFIRYWDIDKSEVDEATGGYEPKNKTTEYGINLIWRF